MHIRDFLLLGWRRGKSFNEVDREGIRVGSRNQAKCLIDEDELRLGDFESLNEPR